MLSLNRQVPSTFFLTFYLNFTVVVLVTKYADEKDKIIRNKWLKENQECRVTTKEIKNIEQLVHNLKKIGKIIKQCQVFVNMKI